MSTNPEPSDARSGALKLTAEMLRSAELPVALRGYSKPAVSALLDSAADALLAAERERTNLAAEIERAGRGEVPSERLMGLVGDNVADVLSEAQHSATQLKAEIEAQAEEALESARETSERVMLEAEEKARGVRQAAQESADSLLAEARRDKESMRAAAEDAAAALRAEAKADAERQLGEAEAESSGLLESATDQSRELRDSSDREAKRRLQEAREISATKIKAAEDLAAQTVSSARSRAREIESDLARSREEGEAAIQQLGQAREVLTGRLTAAHNGLVQLLTQVGERNGGPLLSVETTGSSQLRDELSTGGSPSVGDDPAGEIE